jgi:hypothetical protein
VLSPATKECVFNIYLWILRDMAVYFSPLNKCFSGLVPKYLQQETLWNAQRCPPTQFLTYCSDIQVWTWQSIYFASFWYMADRIPFQSNITSMRNHDQKRGRALQYDLYISVREFMYFPKFHSRQKAGFTSDTDEFVSGVLNFWHPWRFGSSWYKMHMKNI